MYFFDKNWMIPGRARSLEELDKVVCHLWNRQYESNIYEDLIGSQTEWSEEQERLFYGEKK